MAGFEQAVKPKIGNIRRKVHGCSVSVSNETSGTSEVCGE